MVRLQQAPILIESIEAEFGSAADGAVALFLGRVRDHNQGRKVLRLEYEAYEEMALVEMEKIERQALERFDISRVAMVHRTGVLEIGQVSVIVGVAAPHRAAAFEACRFAIDALKQTVPVWKKEFFEGGEIWIEGGGETASQA